MMLLVFRNIFLSTKFFIFLNFMLIHRHISALPIHEYCNNDIGNYTKNSNFQSNLNTVISSISSKINTFGFYNNSAGDGVDQVNAIAFCRGDIDIESCRVCLNEAARNLTQLCPNQMEAIRWYDECEFRYSNKKILGVVSSTGPYYRLLNVKNVSNIDSFSRSVHTFAGDLVEQAYNGTYRKYAGLNHSDAIFGLMQCSPDITPDDCMNCLQTCENYLSAYYYREGGRVFTPSCIFRYELYSFLYTLSYPSSPPPPPPSLPPPPPPPIGKSKTIIIIIVVCAMVAPIVLTLIWVFVFFNKRRWQNTTKRKTFKGEVEELEGLGDGETRQYDFALIRASTNDFSTANLLGRGGFGDVFKGVLSNGKEIAVKRLSTTSIQGETEFRNEVILLAKLQHKYLVRLLGFCLEQTERLLVYEFMENGSLNNIIFADVVNRSRLDWGLRYKIINSVAKGLLYLHEGSRLMIIHRDLKVSNILLDGEMNAKISDFGTAKLFVWDESVACTKLIAGTMGYMAPEYALYGQFSVKSDVYSFGVLLLEILSGKRNDYSFTEDASEGLLIYAYNTWKDGRASDLIDPVLKMAHENSPEIIIRCIYIALLCVQEDIESRPTMATVVLMLQRLTTTMPLPSEPGFFNNTSHWLSEFHESTSPASPSKSKLVHASSRFDASVTDESFDFYPR